MPGEKTTHGHPGVWALLTILTFPIVLLSTDALGYTGPWPFLFALLATAIVLALEALVRGRLWPFEPQFVEHIGHPDTPVRVMIFAAACLFILETAFLLIMATNRHLDPAIMHWIAQRQCAARRDQTSQALCQYLRQPMLKTQTASAGSAKEYALRTQAARLWFPEEPLVTCAVRNLNQSEVVNGRTRIAALARCTTWNIDDAGTIRSKRSVTRFIGAQLILRDDGLYRVEAWADDYASPNWDTALGEIADAARQNAQSLAILPDFITLLEAEALGRAQQLLGK